MTENEARVLELLKQTRRPLRAYDLVEQFRPGKTTGPPTIYRALAKLVEKGLVHRVESLNAYVPRRCSSDGQSAALVVCDSCHDVHEVDGPQIDGLLAPTGDKPDFVASRVYLEVHGICDSCHEDDDPRAVDNAP